MPAKQKETKIRIYFQMMFSDNAKCLSACMKTKSVPSHIGWGKNMLAKWCILGVIFDHFYRWSTCKLNSLHLCDNFIHHLMNLRDRLGQTAHSVFRRFCSLFVDRCRICQHYAPKRLSWNPNNRLNYSWFPQSFIVIVIEISILRCSLLHWPRQINQTFLFPIKMAQRPNLLFGWPKSSSYLLQKDFIASFHRSQVSPKE